MPPCGRAAVELSVKLRYWMFHVTMLDVRVELTCSGGMGRSATRSGSECRMAGFGHALLNDDGSV